MQLLSYMTPGFPESLFEALAHVLDAELHLDQTTSGPRPGGDPFEAGRFDLGWVCSTSYVDLALRAEEPSVDLAGVAWVPDDPDAAGRPIYFGDLIVAPHSEARSLADLEGARIGCNDPVSLSGHHALRFAIEQAGADPDSFADLTFTGGHNQSMARVLSGDLDAAVVDSVVRISRSRRDREIAALSVVARLGPWPVQPLVIRSGLDPSVAAEVRAALLAANEIPEVVAELRAAALTKLVEVGPDHYAPVHRALAGR